MLSLVVGALSCGQMACAGSPRVSDEPTTPVAATGTLELAGLQEHFAKIADAVTPSIVAISAVGADISPAALLIDAEVDGPQLAAALDRVSRTVGTGFIIDADGYILTDEHVVSNAEQLWITTDDKRVFPAMVVGSDPRADLAVLKIAATGLKAVKFAPPDSVKRGQWALTLGNPYGLATGGELAMSVGVVSATNRSLPRLSSQENRLYTNLIQTTAEINPGNSGGPLFDLEGRVIGVNAAVVLPQKNTNGIGFAFAANSQLLNKVKMMKAGEAIEHAYVGVSVSSASDNGTGGARIDSLVEDGPSANSGLKVGDVVVRVNSTEVGSSDSFAKTVGALPLEKSATLRFIRGGKEMTAKITPRPRPGDRVAVSRYNQHLTISGMTLESCDEGMRISNITDTSPFRKQGLVNGQLVTGVAGKKASSMVEMLTLLSGRAAASVQLDRVMDSAAVATAEQ